MRQILTALFLVFALLLSACGAGSTPPASPTLAPTPSLSTIKVARGDIIQELTLYGRIQPVDTKDLKFAAGGNIRNVYVNPDSPVKKGQLLADLDVLGRLEGQLADAQDKANLATQAFSSRLRRGEIAAEIAQLNLNIAKARNASPDEIRLAELQVELANLDLAEIQASVTLAENSSEINRLTEALEAARLYAPADGRLIGSLEPGKPVQANVAFGVVGDPSRLEMVVAAQESEVSLLHEGITVTVVMDADKNHPLVGTIRQLPYPYGSGGPISGYARVAVTLDKTPAQAGYKVGDSGEIRFVQAKRLGVLWLPPEVIRTVGGRTFVYVLGPKGQQRVNVTLGLFNRERVEILDGLGADQLVVVP